MHPTTVAIDLAKDVFEIVIADTGGAPRERRRLSRRQFERFVDELPAGTHVVMEACGTAHYWARRCQARTACVRLLPPHYVRPYVRRNKTDRTDAEALLEANRCGGIHPVPVKTPEQQAIQALHRVRTQWQRTRTARINTIRALFREQGIVVPVSAARLRARARTLLEEALAMPDLIGQTIALLVDELQAVEQGLAQIDRRILQVARQHPVARRLQQVPGVGALTATALVGSVTHIHRFRRGRQFASWLGLTPREWSSGARRTLGGISKRGDRYLRCLLAHGARSVLRAAMHGQRTGTSASTRVHRWVLEVAARRGHNRAVIALANKLARIIWAVWSRDQDLVLA
jgi:transposase